MLLQTWFSSFSAQRLELKFASIFALAAAIVVVLILAWTSFFSAPNNQTKTASSPSMAVQTFERPSVPQSTVAAPEAEPNHTPLTPKPRPPEKKAEPSIPKVTLTIGQGNYYVQVGAFSQAKLARLMLEKMRKQYKFAKIKQKADKHAVWVGPVITQHDAQTLKKYLQRKSNLQGFIMAEQ